MVAPLRTLLALGIDLGPSDAVTDVTEESWILSLDKGRRAWHDAYMTSSHTNCSHPATKAARAACRKDRAAAALAPRDPHADSRPALWDGYILYCELCAADLFGTNDQGRKNYRHISDLRGKPCPCGRRWEDGTAYASRFICTNEDDALTRREVI